MFQQISNSQPVVENLGFGSGLSTTFLITNYLTNIWLKMSEIGKSLATTNDVILTKRSGPYLDPMVS